MREVPKAVYVRPRDHVADAYGMVLGRNTWIGNIDVVTAPGEILTGGITQYDVLMAGYVVNQCTFSDGGVASTICVAK
jgi:hypothetical protein